MKAAIVGIIIVVLSVLVLYNVMSVRIYHRIRDDVVIQRSVVAKELGFRTVKEKYPLSIGSAMVPSAH